MTINSTNIQWTHLPGRDDGYTANPIRFRNRETGEPVTWACVKVSDGCKNCYAETLALRYGKGSAYTVPNMAKLEPVLDEKVMHAMLTSRKISGAAVFLGDMTDLFGEWVPDDMLDRIFAVMGLRPDVTWQLLTKRPERMRAFVERVNWYECTREGLSKANPVFEAIGKLVEGRLRLAQHYRGFSWPLPNVWLGTSVEDQPSADERIPHLLATPAAVRFLSCEPLLEGVQLPWMRPFVGGPRIGQCPIDWVIVGGESGPHARPCDVAWIRSIVAQCQAAHVPVVVKQLGSKPAYPMFDGERGGIDEALDVGMPLGWRFEQDGSTWRRDPTGRRIGHMIRLRSGHGSDMAEWPEDLRVRQFPGDLTSPDARGAPKPG